ncbi:hypothetical protein C2G38_2165173 [Gigaspora rosea]|uniref:Uncharacterized protein n=1 Tax=Gigaspora rosea TaxID=44941 RepID=A0A397VT76_9GLOM|nr:hypothetical protein C2G38_2165173 [Gigaspora rosea]
METNEENSRKRNANLVDVTENSSESEKEHATNSSNQQSSTKKKSRQFAEIWDYYLRGGEKKAHLANECPNCPENISRYWYEKVAERNSNYTRKKALPNQTAITSHFLSDRPLPKAAINRLDQKIIKAWVMAGVPFEVIKNPFIKDMFKEFLPAYNPPSRTTLSGRLLDEKIA